MMINIRTYLLRLWNNMKTKDEGCWCTTDWLFQKLLIGFQFSKVLNYQRRNGRNSEILHQMTLSLILDDVIVEAILKLSVNILNFPAELKNTFFLKDSGRSAWEMVHQPFCHTLKKNLFNWCQKNDTQWPSRPASKKWSAKQKASYYYDKQQHRGSFPKK